MGKSFPAHAQTCRLSVTGVRDMIQADGTSAVITVSQLRLMSQCLSAPVVLTKDSQSKNKVRCVVCHVLAHRTIVKESSLEIRKHIQQFGIDNFVRWTKCVLTLRR